MRTVEIDKDGLLTDTEHGFHIICPERSRVSVCDTPCWHGCAWFSVEALKFIDTSGNLVIEPNTNAAYCKDHCIGRVKEPDNG